jgi:hypothetical protein
MKEKYFGALPIVRRCTIFHCESEVGDMPALLFWARSLLADVDLFVGIEIPQLGELKSKQEYITVSEDSFI